jgi:hypothetical protein
LPSEKILAIPYSDGMGGWVDPIFEGYDSEVILGVVAYTNPRSSTITNKAVCLPLDDETFQIGLRQVLEREAPNLNLPWEERINKAYFRGVGIHQCRRKVARELEDFEHSDLKFVKTPWLTEDEFRDNERFYEPFYDGTPQPIKLTEFIKHKYILILDGILVASSLQWVFGSGSVPILVTDPTTEFWFKSLLVNGENCVIVDTSRVVEGELQRVIKFLVDNDDVAKKIANNALELSLKIFSPEFQRQYLVEQLS